MSWFLKIFEKTFGDPELREQVKNILKEGEKSLAENERKIEECDKDLKRHVDMVSKLVANAKNENNKQCFYVLNSKINATDEFKGTPHTLNSDPAVNFVSNIPNNQKDEL